MLHIIGKERIDYVSKKTSKLVQGWRYYYLEEDNRVEGFKCGNFFVDEKTYNSDFSTLCVDDFVTVYYNQYGYIVGCSIIKSN